MSKVTQQIVSALCVVAAALGASACGGDDKNGNARAVASTTLPQGSEPVELNPDDFSPMQDRFNPPARPVLSCTSSASAGEECWSASRRGGSPASGSLGTAVRAS